jgi:hypothetical protein
MIDFHSIGWGSIPQHRMRDSTAKADYFVQMKIWNEFFIFGDASSKYLTNPKPFVRVSRK